MHIGGAEKLITEIIKDFENDGITKEWVDFHSEELIESIEENGTLDNCDKNLPIDRQIAKSSFKRSNRDSSRNGYKYSTT